MKVLFNVLIYLLLMMFIAGCSAPENGSSGGPYTISGTVKSGTTGAVIEGATVQIGATAVLTSAAGAFSFTYTDSAPLTTSVYVYKGTTHTFFIAHNVTFDVTNNPVYTIPLYEFTDPPEITLSGNLPVTAGPNPSLDLRFVTAAGVISSVYFELLEDDTTYSLSVRAGEDCFVYVNYIDDNGSIVQYYTHVDLTSNHTLNIVDLADTNVTINGTEGDRFMADLYLGNDIYLVNYCNGSITSGTSKSVNIYNPDNLPIRWNTFSQTPDTPVAGVYTMRSNFGTTGAFSATATLPGPASAVPVPTALVNTAACTWDSGTRTITFPSAAGANHHLLSFFETNIEGFILVENTIGSGDLSISFPAAFYNDVIVPAGTLNALFSPMYVSKSLSESPFLGFMGGGINYGNAVIQCGLLSQSMASAVFGFIP